MSSPASSIASSPYSISSGTSSFSARISRWVFFFVSTAVLTTSDSDSLSCYTLSRIDGFRGRLTTSSDSEVSYLFEIGSGLGIYAGLEVFWSATCSSFLVADLVFGRIMRSLLELSSFYVWDFFSFVTRFLIISSEESSDFSTTVGF